MNDNRRKKKNPEESATKNNPIVRSPESGTRLLSKLLEACKTRCDWPAMDDEQQLATVVGAELEAQPELGQLTLGLIFDDLRKMPERQIAFASAHLFSCLAVLGLCGLCAAPQRYKQVVRSAVRVVTNRYDPQAPVMAAVGRALAAGRPMQCCGLVRGVHRLAEKLASMAEPGFDTKTPASARGDMLSGLSGLLRSAAPAVRARVLDARLAAAAARAARANLHDNAATVAAVGLLGEVASDNLGERHGIKKILVTIGAHTLEVL